MPRTKQTKASTNKFSQKDYEAYKADQHNLKQQTEDFIAKCEMTFEQHIENSENIIGNMINRLSKNILKMTMSEYKIYLENPNQEAICSSTSDLMISTNNSNVTNKSKNSRDEGYITENSVHSSRKTGRKMGPLSSAKARNRRSQSAHTISAISSKNVSGLGLANHSSNYNTSHTSRAKYRTPHQNRLQTMSADRYMNPVTPKMQANTPVSMLRYPRMGETVISLSGSPVIVQGVVHESANINIPISDGIFSVQPSAISAIDSELVSRIDVCTLNQLKQLQSNLNMIMSHVMQR